MIGIDPAILESLPCTGALTDESGEIVCVNQAWTGFEAQNELGLGYDAVGEDYLDIVRDVNSPLPDSVGEHFLELLQGERSRVTAEYPCHSPEERRWFRLYAKEVGEADDRGVLILHENITDERITETIADSIGEPLLTHLQHRSEEFCSESVSNKAIPDDRGSFRRSRSADNEFLETGIEAILRAAYNTGSTVEGIYSSRNESPYPDWEIRIDRVANQSDKTQD
jgi:hypothetical protein